jgi:micrococcal nuclease
VRRRSPFLLLLVLAVAAVAQRVDLGSGSGSTAGELRAGKQLHARVVRVVDGDTIVVALGGRQERVRYIGVDTPETVKPRTPVQCFGKAASHFNHRLVDGRTVELTMDAEARDRYGRLLAYVRRRPDGLFVNAELVRRGYARTMTIPPNVRYADRFAALARRARNAGEGLWHACGR